VLFKDRGVGTHEQVLNVSIACWRYELGKPSSRLSIEACRFPTASLTVMGEELGMDPQTVSQRAVGWVGSRSSREQWICSNLLTTMRKVAMR
jgi:hypothetical protein